MSPLPAAILFDLDDTIIQAYARPEEAWQRLLAQFAADLDNGGSDSLAAVQRAILGEARAFWGDPVNAAKWRLDIATARRLVVRRALARLHRPNDALADRIGDAFTAMRRAEYQLFPDALDTLRRLRTSGVRLALVTNGQAEMQRAKVVRFDLERHFDHIQIEGEFGKGKPEPEVYRHVLDRLRVTARQSWMVGDNIEWEVAAPQRLGIRGIWYDPHGQGLPAGSRIRPDRIIARLRDILD